MNTKTNKNVQQYIIDQELHKKLEDSPYYCIPYGCVEGEVKSMGTPLRSHFKVGVEGVIQHSSMVEHKSRRVQGFWSDVKNVVRDTLEVIPFYLVPHGESQCLTRIMVTEPNSAYHVDEELSLTYENFIQPQTDLFKKGMELISGEVNKGYQETEKMLLVGSHLLAIGKLVKEGDTIKMKPPSSEYRYIISRKTKDELVRLLRNRGTLLKVFVGLFGVTGVALIIYLVYRFFRKRKNYNEEQRLRRDFQHLREEEEQRRARAAHRTNPDSLSSGAGSTDSSDWENNKCVVCLTNEREVVLLECGHVCLCGDCAFALPDPKMCPICRGKVVRFVTTYTP
ncbi:mitochondrial ubiquitin ligase activator of NFKB 1-like isoform X2 [Ostrea edulis]|uniref:mitochondrial ubiquitin ligase activator of NFKB 1-like isoform X2 n=1 Tax=Ostrea edulis TaxID=37623 RepID=UPI0024AFC570|nr:mitochondrial ubiquitin ligase activator of NFKB 1-like isoform X2 [Ostrea edulis]